ncbi:hypothetical protein MKW98_020546 [Papaver atlanticum]|uniref:Uncharacterized protein n=1 Tax=Papaver atlanticum TaxID=357466 RepID=A0AAD4SPJ1_9MAGN|nr:hypothetical protein MKW98_020546 [Papaver atlanticum]
MMKIYFNLGTLEVTGIRDRLLSQWKSGEVQQRQNHIEMNSDTISHLKGLHRDEFVREWILPAIPILLIRYLTTNPKMLRIRAATSANNTT